MKIVVFVTKNDKEEKVNECIDRIEAHGYNVDIVVDDYRRKSRV